MGRVVHFEITADDVSRAKRFYETVFGWRIEQWEGMDYWAVYTGDQKDDPAAKWGGIDGGMVKRDGQPPLHDSPVTAYVCTITVDSLDESCKQVVEHGGSIIVEKRPIPGAGWMCYCKDTEGNMFSMMELDESAA